MLDVRDLETARQRGATVAKALADPTPGPAHGCMSRDPNDPNAQVFCTTDCTIPPGIVY